MQICYIILAHKIPKQVRILVERLSGENIYFYIHVDKKADIKPFLEEMKSLHNIVFLPKEKRENTTWGDIGIVKATINAMIEIKANPRKGYTILLSGQDYPIKDNKYIYSYLKDNYGVNFIDKVALPSNGILFQGLDRINRYKFNISNSRGHYVQLFSILEHEFYSKKNLKNILSLIKHNKYQFLLKIFSKRKFPSNIRPYFGSQWWGFTSEMIIDIIDFIEHNPDYIKYHKYSLIPDEMFFQSIVMYLAKNNPFLNIKNSLTYTNWSRKNCELPVTFALPDFDELIEQPAGKLFARKFDIDLDHQILNKLDAFHISVI